MSTNEDDARVNPPEAGDSIEPEMNELDPGPKAGAILPDVPPPQAAPMPAAEAGTGVLDETTALAPSTTSAPGSPLSLFDRADAELFCTRWNEIQAKFVDEPRWAVQQADTLIAEVVEKFTQKIASEHSTLQGRWNESNALSTEDLRNALLHYRDFFDRLVA